VNYTITLKNFVFFAKFLKKIYLQPCAALGIKNKKSGERPGLSTRVTPPMGLGEFTGQFSS